jgi:hypothetical protein
MARSANDCNRWRPAVLQHMSGVTISDREGVTQDVLFAPEGAEEIPCLGAVTLH